MNNSLVIVPCGRKKIWDEHPQAGPTEANHAYQSGLFRLHREWAIKQGGKWLILSAKYGFIWPDFIISGPYNVSFTDKTSGVIGLDRLKAQVLEMDLDQYIPIVGLGGKEYRNMITKAFQVPVRFPFTGLPIGKLMQALKADLGQ
jgi:Family of unknown function (DUF6884)